MSEPAHGEWMQYWNDQLYGRKEKDAEILRLREDNRKLRGAIEKKDRRLIRDRAIEIQENPNRTREWTDKESIDKAKEQLRAEGVIE